MEHVMLIPDLTAEYRTLELGDRRREWRALFIADRMQMCPAGSLPKLFPDPSELEAVYRFIHNACKRRRRRTRIEILAWRN